jgi:hypothetical protein
MGRSTGVAASRVLAGLQIIVGHFSVEPLAEIPRTLLPLATEGWGQSPGQTPAATPRECSFAMSPPNIRNRIWLVFRGTRNEHTGGLEGEIVPDFQMRLLGLVHCVVFAIGGLAILGALVVPLLRGDAPFAFGLVWGSFAMAFGVVWVRDYGAAVHNVAANVNRDSPGSPVTWHRGLRCGSRGADPTRTR